MNKAIKKLFTEYIDKYLHHKFLFPPFPNLIYLFERPWLIETIPWFSGLSGGAVVLPWEYSFGAFDIDAFPHLSTQHKVDLANNWRWIVSQIRSQDMVIQDLRVLGIPTPMKTIKTEPQQRTFQSPARGSIERLLAGIDRLEKQPNYRPEQAPMHRELITDGWRRVWEPGIFQIKTLENDTLQFPYFLWQLPARHWESVPEEIEPSMRPFIRDITFNIWCFLEFISCSQLVVVYSSDGQKEELSKYVGAPSIQDCFQKVLALNGFKQAFEGMPALTVESIRTDSRLFQVAVTSFQRYVENNSIAALYAVFYGSCEHISNSLPSVSPELREESDPSWYANKVQRMFGNATRYRELVL